MLKFNFFLNLFFVETDLNSDFSIDQFSNKFPKVRRRFRNRESANFYLNQGTPTERERKISTLDLPWKDILKKKNCKNIELKLRWIVLKGFYYVCNNKNIMDQWENVGLLSPSIDIYDFSLVDN